MASRIEDGKTLATIWADQQGRVHADFFFEGMDRLTALKVNMRLDQLKGQVVAGFEVDLGPRSDEEDGLPERP